MTQHRRGGPQARLAAAGIAAILALAAPGPAAAESGDLLHVGDRLKITVYEVVDSADRAGEPQEPGEVPPVQTAYPRLDLSGEYLIEASGRVMLPLIGTFDAVDRPVEALRTQIGDAFVRTFRRRPDIAVTFVQRAPVYVVGAVRNPGAFPFAAGLFVAQALALAGGDLTNAPPERALELVRGREQREAARERLKAQLVRRAVAKSESEGAALVPDEGLIKLVGAETAAGLVSREQRLMKLRAQERSGARAVQERAVATAAEEVELLSQRLANYDAQVKARGDRLRIMEGLFSRQVVENERVVDIRRDYADMEGRRRDIEISLLQSRQRLEAVKRTLEQGELDRRLALENELVRATGELREAERGFEAASAVAGLLARGPGQDASEPAAVAYEILRRRGGGLETLHVGQGEMLEPGDVLRVQIGRPGEGVGKVAEK
jgi:polysaccharide biosynthesis/export protein ExoF